MLTVIENLPDHVFGVRASGEVTKDDLKDVLLPGCYVSPGEARGYEPRELQAAKDWLNIKS